MRGYQIHAVATAGCSLSATFTDRSRLTAIYQVDGVPSVVPDKPGHARDARPYPSSSRRRRR